VTADNDHSEERQGPPPLTGAPVGAGVAGAEVAVGEALVRVEYTKPDGRRLSVYRRREASRG
jgi:hypothetical protein